MPNIGISGHRGLPQETTTLVDQALRAAIARLSADTLVGVSCIADGADSLFAEAVIDHGGQLEVIVPAEKYRQGLPAEHHRTYDKLIGVAAAVHRLPYDDSTSDAHMAASERMLELVDVLFAVWDGQPARGYGGTADVVSAAREHDVPVTIIWPDGAARD